MMTNGLHPPATGPGSDPVLYGVAAGLAALFPPVEQGSDARERDAAADEDDMRDD